VLFAELCSAASKNKGFLVAVEFSKNPQKRFCPVAFTPL
jgi:hypothetical protein